MKHLVKVIAGFAALVLAPALMSNTFITAKASNYTADWDYYNTSAPPGGSYGYHLYAVPGPTSASAQVQISGPGVSINQSVTSTSWGGSGYFSGTGSVSVYVYASAGSGANAEAGVTLSW